VPEAVAQLEEPHAVLGRHDVAVAVEGGEVRDAGPQPGILSLSHVARGLVVLPLAEVPRGSDLRVVGEVLVAEAEHRVPVHSGLDRGDLLRADRPRDVDAGDLSREGRVQRANRGRHAVRSRGGWPVGEGEMRGAVSYSRTLGRTT